MAVKVLYIPACNAWLKFRYEKHSILLKVWGEKTFMISQEILLIS